MKICTISTFPPRRCGIGDYTYNFIRELSRYAEVSVITYREPGALEKEEIAGVTVYRVLRKDPRDIRTLGNLIAEISPQVVHNQIFNFVPITYLAYPEVRKIPLITTAHETPFSLRYLHLAPLLWFLYRLSSMVIVHSDVVKSSLTDIYRVPEKKIRKIPHGVGTRRFGTLPERREARRQLGLKESGSVILFLGFVQARKGILDLLEAFSKIKAAHDASLLLAGGEDSKHRALVSRKLDTLGIGERVVRTGDIDFKTDRLLDCLAAADVVVFPYLKSSQSGPLHIAMAAGKAVVASDVGGFREVIEDGVNGILVPVGDSKSLTSGIERILSDKEFARNLGENAREKVKPMDWKNIAQITLEFYKEVLEGRM